MNKLAYELGQTVAKEAMTKEAVSTLEYLISSGVLGAGAGGLASEEGATGKGMGRGALGGMAGGIGGAFGGGALGGALGALSKKKEMALILPMLLGGLGSLGGVIGGGAYAGSGAKTPPLYHAGKQLGIG